MTARVRPAVAADAGDLAALVSRLNAHQGDPTEFFSAERALADWIDGPQELILRVGDLDGRLVGYATAWPAYESGYAERGFYLADLYVDVAARRTGLGRRLVAAIAAEARRRGSTYLWWASKDWNTEAAGWYDRLGAISEPVTAHALIRDRFQGLADEGDAGRS
jgi:GNAT superfamily N-acetyltransferase